MERTRTHSDQAYQILHIAFTVAPLVAGLDKFFHLLVNWDQYLAPVVARLLPFPGHTFMLLVGVIEIVAALLVWWKPRLGAYVVMAWLWGIIVNLLLIPGYYDVARRPRPGAARRGRGTGWSAGSGPRPRGLRARPRPLLEVGEVVLPVLVLA